MEPAEDRAWRGGQAKVGAPKKKPSGQSGHKQAHPKRTLAFTSATAPARTHESMMLSQEDLPPRAERLEKAGHGRP